MLRLWWAHWESETWQPRCGTACRSCSYKPRESGKHQKNNKKKNSILTTRNWRTFTQHSTERRDFHLWYLWLTTFKMSHVLRHMVLEKLLQVASHSETLATSCACPHSSFKLGLSASCRFVHVINISHGYYSPHPHTQSYNKHICFSVMASVDKNTVTNAEYDRWEGEINQYRIIVLVRVKKNLIQIQTSADKSTTKQER